MLDPIRQKIEVSTPRRGRDPKGQTVQDRAIWSIVHTIVSSVTIDMPRVQIYLTVQEKREANRDKSRWSYEQYVAGIHLYKLYVHDT
jgi:hypothetical protein